jgi:hypothetical protein
MAETWAVLADLLLQREALVCRVAEGRPPRDFAGLYVSADDLDRVLTSLPGVDGPGPETVEPMRARFAGQLAAARAAFAAELSAAEDIDTARPFAALCRAADLDPADAEVLALLAAVETSAARQRLVAYLQDSVHLPQLTLGSLARILAEPDHVAERAVAPDAPLRRAELIEVTGTGPWAVRTCAPPARVVWHLRGDGSADPGLPPGTVRVPGGRADGGPALVLINGGDAESRLRAVEDLWPGAGRVEAPVPENPAGWAALVREATIGPALVVLALDKALDAAARDAITRTTHLRWVLSSTLEQPLDSLPARPWREIRVGSGEADEGDWRRVLGRRPDPQYRLSRDQLKLVAAASGSAGGADWPGLLDRGLRFAPPPGTPGGPLAPAERKNTRLYFNYVIEKRILTYSLKKKT